MRLSGITSESIVDGPGLRYVLFTQGCPHACEHCHNPDSWSLQGGDEVPVRGIIRNIKRMKNTIRGVTFSGGEPFLQCAELAQVATAAHETGRDVVTYTGFTYEDLVANQNSDVHALLSESDILVDGAYVHKLQDIGLRFRGSSNQRVIDMAQTRRCGKVVLFCE